MVTLAARELIDAALRQDLSESPLVYNDYRPPERVAQVLVDQTGKVQLWFDVSDMLVPSLVTLDAGSAEAEKVIQAADLEASAKGDWRSGSVPYEALVDIPGLGDDVKLSLEHTVHISSNDDGAVMQGHGLSLSALVRRFPWVMVSRFSDRPSHHMTYLGYKTVRMYLTDKHDGVNKPFNVSIPAERFDEFSRAVARLAVKNAT